MKKNLLLLLFICFSLSINAQIQFKDATCQTSFAANDTIYLENEIAFAYNLFNAGSNQINCKLEIVELQLPNGNNYLTMCSSGACYPITEPRVITNSQTIEPNSCTTDLKDIEYSNGNATTRLFVRIKATNLNNTNDTASLCFMYPAPSANINFSKNHKISIFPNPVSNFIYINFDSKKIENAQIINSNGQLSATFELENKSTMVDISYLPKGLYLLKIDNSIQKIIKK